MNSLIEWFAKNGVAANLLAIFIAIVGVMTIGTLRQEVFPEFSSDMIYVRVVYPGAAPEEVEEGISQKVEEAIHGLTDVKKVTSTSQENAGSVMVELNPGTDAARALEEGGDAVGQGLVRPQPHPQLHVFIRRHAAAVRSGGGHELGGAPAEAAVQGAGLARLKGPGLVDRVEARVAAVVALCASVRGAGVGWVGGGGQPTREPERVIMTQLRAGAAYTSPMEAIGCWTAPQSAPDVAVRELRQHRGDAGPEVSDIAPGTRGVARKVPRQPGRRGTSGRHRGGALGSRPGPQRPPGRPRGRRRERRSRGSSPSIGR